ncbi:MAG: leucyl/phenylalanyl-tRNA--protein transferase [Microthrixaceae bacterium]|nr:leucyl/phenylalanyl-tRNA--protein transferase [Microthrixaceae bacterium]
MPPLEPEPTLWDLPDPRDAPPGDDLIGLGADLEPGTLLAAYRAGLFPMPTRHLPRPRSGRPGRALGWWSPDPRGIVPLDGLRVTRSLRRSVRRYEVRVDGAFTEVVVACADPSRPHGWISEEIVAAYTRLHELGWAHSVETWCDGVLVGGLYGVSVGGLFAGESMFHRERDASKVALVGLVELLRAASPGADGRLLDVQWLTPHLASLGAVDVTRGEYLDRLAAALPLPDAFSP